MFRKHNILPGDYWNRDPKEKKVIRALAIVESEDIEEELENMKG